MPPVWTVVGIIPTTRRRIASHIWAWDARAAEDEATAQAAELGELLWPCGVLPGQLDAVDLYAYYVDPDQPSPEPDTPSLSVPAGGIVEPYTVIGLIRNVKDTAWNAQYSGQRYATHQEAINPRLAEDLAAFDAGQERGGSAVLWVAGVFAGRHLRADAYAPFVDPELTTLASELGRER